MRPDDVSLDGAGRLQGEGRRFGGRSERQGGCCPTRAHLHEQGWKKTHNPSGLRGDSAPQGRARLAMFNDRKRDKPFLRCVVDREEVSFPSTKAENHSKKNEREHCTMVLRRRAAAC